MDNRLCKICGESFSPRTNNAKLCDNKECDIINRKQTARKHYLNSIKDKVKKPRKEYTRTKPRNIEEYPFSFTRAFTKADCMMIALELSRNVTLEIIANEYGRDAKHIKEMLNSQSKARYYVMQWLKHFKGGYYEQTA